MIQSPIAKPRRASDETVKWNGVGDGGRGPPGEHLHSHPGLAQSYRPTRRWRQSTVERHLYTVSFGVRNSIDAQLEINRAHNAVAEFFFDRRLERGAENLRDFVEAIN